MAANALAPMRGLMLILTLLQLGLASKADPSVARIWDEEILSAIRIDLPNPPVHARNLFHFSVTVYDAWAAYDTNAVGVIYHQKHAAGDLDAARREAISYAAYRILRERYALSKGASTTLAALDRRLTQQGYNTNDMTLDPTRPAGVGNRVASAVSAFYFNDGARQAQSYQDATPAQGGYQPINPPLPLKFISLPPLDVNRWQPLAITDAQTQNGILVSNIQVFLGSQWRDVRPFAMTRETPASLWMDPGPPPHLNSPTDAQFRQEVLRVIEASSELTPDDGVTMDISPGAFGNNTLGANDGHGHPLNPATGQTYATNLVKRGDFARVLAEFWADGPKSETPPGHWNVLANQVSDHPALVRQIGGTGPLVDALEWDVKVYLTLNAALHDAACAAWTLKRQYDGWRPIAAIRYMAERGQSSDPTQPSYDPNGLQLVPGLVELVTTATAQPGGRHAGFHAGSLVLRTWPGQPADPTNQYSGVRWIAGWTWLPYQKGTFVTPSFPGYVSGHSTFSRAGAEVLAAITGSCFFPGGLGSYTVTSLSFEAGPTTPVTLQWGTYFDAADQAGISRIWGGIHVPIDDFTGRKMGAECGRMAWTLASQYFDGSVAQQAFAARVRVAPAKNEEIRIETVRGLSYQLQSSPALDRPFASDATNSVIATDSNFSWRIPLSESNRFFRVLESAN